MKEKALPAVRSPPVATYVPKVATRIILGVSHIENAVMVSIFNFFL
jgi:hypothetical protein